MAKTRIVAESSIEEGMRMRRAFVLLALSIAVVFSPHKALGAQPAGLALELSAEKSTYAPYEPVVLGYALVNRGRTSVDVSGLVGTQADGVTFEVTNAKGVFRRYRTGPIACGVADDRRLEPGASVRGQVIMISNQIANLGRVGERPEDAVAAYPFGAPGTYEVRATHLVVTDKARDQRRALVSTPAKIIVREPTRREQDAVAFFGSPAELVLAMGGERVGVEARKPDDRDMGLAVQRWEGFVAGFGDTPYASFIRLHLAETYRSDPRVVPSRPDLASEHLRIVAETGPQSIADDALLELAEAALDNNRLDEAKRATAKLVREFPSSERIGDAKRIAEGLKAGRTNLKEIYDH